MPKLIWFVCLFVSILRVCSRNSAFVQSVLGFEKDLPICIPETDQKSSDLLSGRVQLYDGLPGFSPSVRFHLGRGSGSTCILVDSSDSSKFNTLFRTLRRHFKITTQMATLECHLVVGYNVGIFRICTCPVEPLVCIWISDVSVRG